MLDPGRQGWARGMLVDFIFVEVANLQIKLGYAIYSNSSIHKSTQF